MNQKNQNDIYFIMILALFQFYLTVVTELIIMKFRHETYHSLETQLFIASIFLESRIGLVEKKQLIDIFVHSSPNSARFSNLNIFRLVFFIAVYV